MKKFVITTCLIALFLPLISFSATVNSGKAGLIAQGFLMNNSKMEKHTLYNCYDIVKDGETLAFAFNLSPTGYIVVSANDVLPPVIAFSVESSFGNRESSNPLFSLLVADLPKRLFCAESINPEYAFANRQLWEQMLDGSYYTQKGEPEQWPANAEGWISSSWNQSAPYNNMCPMDPITHARSYTGCPATAMAMIFNYYGTTNGVQLSDEDDYHHNYAGRNFWIDDDFESIGFPSFPDLNKYLDTLNMHYQSKNNITNNDLAALSFACGVAAHTVYTSQGSGTFAVSQAYDAYLRFGCTTAVLMYPEEEGIFDSIIQNMKDAMPVHLAVVDESNSSGHNLAIDGYRSDNYYHLDYGYGEYYNGWYLVPSEIQMGLTVIEGVVVNIMKQNPSGCPMHQTETIKTKVFPQPATDFVFIEYQCEGIEEVQISVYDLSGSKVINNKLGLQSKGNRTVQLNIGNLSTGMYFYQITSTGLFIKGNFIIIR